MTGGPVDLQRRGHRDDDPGHGHRQRSPPASPTDPAGNRNAASTSADNTVTWDNVPPTVTIDLRAASDTGASNTDDLTNAASLVFDVTFSETVTGLAANDFSNVGTATGCAFGAPGGSGAAYTSR